MRFHIKAAIIAMLAALPIMTLATFFWIRARVPSVYSDTIYSFGDTLFQLGFPLTTVLFTTLLDILGGKFTRESELWALPLMNIAFLLQWMIWSQLIVWIRDKFQSKIQ
jgi:hypothetical protein